MLGPHTGGLGGTPPREGQATHVLGVESALRYLGARLDVNVNAHMFRHALAQALVETSGLKVAQEVLGHRHIGTTADTYSHVDQQAMIDALVRAKKWCDLDAHTPSVPSVGTGFVFAYDQMTLTELDSVASVILPDSHER